METSKVAFWTISDLSFEDAVQKCRDSLAAEGFGVLTEIDIQATMKKKLDVDREPYVILGACHPPSAHRALTAVPGVGVLLPCNVTVSVEDGRTVIRAMDPASAMGILEEPELEAVGTEVSAALQRVITSFE